MTGQKWRPEVLAGGSRRSIHPSEHFLGRTPGLFRRQEDPVDGGGWVSVETPKEKQHHTHDSCR